MLPAGAAGAHARATITERNLPERVFWLQSYLSLDRRQMFCIYDGPSPEAIRRAANRNKLPIHRITEVRVLDPHSHP